MGTPTTAISVDRVLSWLPADTETVIVARGPFPMPPERKDDDADDENNRNHLISGEEVVQRVRLLAMGTALFPKDVSEKLLVGQEVALAVDASRHFRPPPGLGGMLFEGAEITVFTQDISARFDQFRKGPENLAATRETIEGRDVEVFTERGEEDNWTIFVTLAKPDTLVFSTNRDYLREVLARVDGAKGRRALPEELPEWKYVNLSSACWGLRHYDKSQSEFDPTSPFGEKKTANALDDGAIGVVFNLHSGVAPLATITYLSASKDALSIVKNDLLPMEFEPQSTKDLRATYREISPGVVQASFTLDRDESTDYFLFLLMARLGHGVYL
jgi:hypothetical protein